ncbi:ribosomal RNA processing protein 1 homolog Nnp-1 [Augochlora pura]
MAVKRAQGHARASLKTSAKRVLGDVKSGKTIIVAQEIKFARLLSSNDKRVRDRILKNLKKWLTVRSKSSFVFTEADFTRLWKGLFYCMWMSDKPLVQEELAESLSRIVHCFDVKDLVLLYTKCAFRTLGTEWLGIDQYRLDKFCMLVRRVIRQTFIKCKERSWDMEWIKGFAEILEKLFVDPKICQGFNMHVTEIFLEELSKVSEGNIPEEVVTELAKPFVSYFIIMDDERQIRHVMRHIFRCLIFQSDIGMDYIDKFQAWRAAGFPNGSIDAVEKIEISDEEEEEYGSAFNTKKVSQSNSGKALDPRAGRVDVELPQIPFNPKDIVTLLTQYKYHPSSTTKSRRQLQRLIKEFVQLSEGKMPLGIKKISLPNTRKKDTDTKLAAKRLLQFEEELYSDTTSKKRKRKRNTELTEDENNTFSEEESKDDTNEDSITRMDAVGKKRKKMKFETIPISSESQINSEISDICNIMSQKKERETKEKIINNKIEETNFKARKNLFPVVKNVNGCKKKKLKKSESAVVNTALAEKQTKVKSCNQWDVSDNTTALTGNGTCLKVVKKSIASDNLQKKNAPKKQLPAWMSSVLKKMENEKNVIEHKVPQHKNVSNSKKRVKIALQRNTAQHTSEYLLQVRRSPSIPYDANRKPLVGVLKASPISNPINPFYRKRG